MNNNRKKFKEYRGDFKTVLELRAAPKAIEDKDFRSFLTSKTEGRFKAI